MVKTKTLPRIRKQTGDGCTSASVCGLMEYFLIRKNPYLKINLDDESMNEEMRESGRVIKAITALDYALKVGVLDKYSGIRYKISGFQKINRNSSFEIKQPCLVGVNLERGEKLQNRLDKDCIIKRRMAGFHAMIAMEPLGKNNEYLVLANSWGLTFGDHGYCYLPRTMQTKTNPFIVEAYTLTI